MILNDFIVLLLFEKNRLFWIFHKLEFLHACLVIDDYKTRLDYIQSLGPPRGIQSHFVLNIY